MCGVMSLFYLQTIVLITLNVHTYVVGRDISHSWRSRDEQRSLRTSLRFSNSDISFKCLSSPNSKLLHVRLRAPSNSSHGISNLDVLSTNGYMSGLRTGCIRWNLTSQGERMSHRHLALPVPESSTVSLTFDLDVLGCGVQRRKVTRGRAYRYFFRSRHLDVERKTSGKSKQTFRKVLYSVRCYFEDNGDAETVVDEKPDELSAEKANLPISPFSRRLADVRTDRHVVREVWSNDNAGLVSPTVAKIEAGEIWDRLKTKFRVSLPIVHPGKDLTAIENISLADHFHELVRTYRRVIEPEKADSFLRGLLHAVDDTVRDIIERQTLAPATEKWATDEKRRSRSAEKRLAIVVGVVLAVLLLATLLMIFLIMSDFRRRRLCEGNDEAAAAKASFCHKICPRRLFASNKRDAAAAGRPLPPIPLPHVEGVIELPPSILDADDTILVESV